VALQQIASGVGDPDKMQLIRYESKFVFFEIKNLPDQEQLLVLMQLLEILQGRFPPFLCHAFYVQKRWPPNPLEEMY